jgi:hypothetical protein
LSLAAFDAPHQTMTWLGVGNVEGCLFRANGATRPVREYLLRRGGIIGYQMEALRTATLPVFAGDTLIFATDGIDGAFCTESPLGRDPQECADDFVSRYAKQSDDALIVVARYLGSPP